MTLPSFPTDSLYKFMALAGLALWIACIVFPSILARDVIKHYNKVLAIAAKLTPDSDLLDLSLDRVKNAEDKDEALQENLKQRIAEVEKEASGGTVAPDLAKALQKDGDAIASDVDKNKRQLSDIASALADLRKRKIDVEEGRQEVLQEIDEIRGYIRDAYVLSFIGAVLMVVGFVHWYFKIQRYQDIIIAKEANSVQKGAPVLRRHASKRPTFRMAFRSRSREKSP